MDILNTILYSVINAFHVYIFFLAYRVFFGRSKLPQYAEALYYTLFYAVNSTAFLAVGNPFLNLATSVLPLFALTFLYEGRLRTKLLIGLFVYVASMLLESGSYSIMLALKLDVIIKNQVIGNLTANLILFVAVLIYGKIRQSKISGHVSLLHWLAIFALPTGSMVIVMLVYAAEYSELTNIVIVALLVGMNVLVFQLYALLDNYYFMQYEHSMLQGQNRAYAHEFELIKQNDENLRIMRHDLKNHVAAMNRLLEHRDWDRLKQYLSEMNNQPIVKAQYVSSGNPEVDSILNYKLAAVEQMAPLIDIDVRIPTQLTLPAYDLNAILGNLLDNAIEELTHCSDKYLKILMYFDRSVLFIQIVNSYSGVVRTRGTGGHVAYLSRKRHSKSQGVGLLSVGRTIEKYNGAMEIETEDQRFTIKMMLYLP